MLKPGDKLIILSNTECQHMRHELNNYPREGIEARPIAKDTVVTFVREFTNFFGTYLVVKDEKEVEYHIQL